MQKEGQKNKTKTKHSNNKVAVQGGYGLRPVVLIKE